MTIKILSLTKKNIKFIVTVLNLVLFFWPVCFYYSVFIAKDKPIAGFVLGILPSIMALIVLWKERLKHLEKKNWEKD